MPFLPPNCMVHDCLYISQLATISGGRSPIHHLGTRLVACSKAPFIGEYNTCSVRTCQLQLRISMTTYFWKCSHCTLKTKKKWRFTSEVDRSKIAYFRILCIENYWNRFIFPRLGVCTVQRCVSLLRTFRQCLISVWQCLHRYTQNTEDTVYINKKVASV